MREVGVQDIKRRIEEPEKREHSNQVLRGYMYLKILVTA
jgi:hypothetical protein